MSDSAVSAIAVRIRNEGAQKAHDFGIEQNRFGPVPFGVSLEILFRREIPKHSCDSLYIVSVVQFAHELRRRSVR